MGQVLWPFCISDLSWFTQSWRKWEMGLRLCSQQKERQSCTLQENATIILPILVQRFIDHEAGSFCGWCQVTAFGYDSPIVYKAHFTKKQLVKPLFLLNKTVLNFQGRTRPSLCWPWLKSQPGGRSQTCFLLLQKQVLFFFLSNSCEVDKESSRQPCERDEPDHPIKLQYFFVHLQMQMAQVAAVLAEPAKAGYSRSWFPSCYPVLVPGFFTSLKFIFIQ